MASAVQQHCAGAPSSQLPYMSSRNMPYLVLERVSRHLYINCKNNYICTHIHIYIYTYVNVHVYAHYTDAYLHICVYMVTGHGGTESCVRDSRPVCQTTFSLNLGEVFSDPRQVPSDHSFDTRPVLSFRVSGTIADQSRHLGRVPISTLQRV